MTGQPLYASTQWRAITGPHYLSGPRSRLNLAQLKNASTLGYLVRGGPMNKILQSGQRIEDELLLDHTVTATEVNPGEGLEAAVFEHGTRTFQEWRVLRDYIVENEIQTHLNKKAATDRYQQVFDHMWQEKQHMYTSSWKKLAQIFYSIPNRQEQDSTVNPGAKKWMSLMAINNECTLGLFGNGFATAPTGGAWTQVQGITPVAGNRWVPVQESYGAGGAGYTLASPANVISALNRAILRAGMSKPPMHQEYFSENIVKGSSDYFFTMSYRMLDKLMFLWRESQDRWEDVRDPWNSPMHRGIPMVYEELLDEYAGYATGSSDTLQTEYAATGGGAQKVGGRMYGWNAKRTFAVFDETYFMKLSVAGEASDKLQPDTTQKAYLTLGNAFTRDRGANIVIYPAADHTI